MNANIQNPTPISAYMITFNNERTVEQALRSLTWADEIVVVDSFSSDRTPEIARKYAHKFMQREWPGFRDQYRFAASQCSNSWAVFLDADEVIPDELVNEVRETLAANLRLPAEKQIPGYYIPRRTQYLGRWIKHGSWASDKEIRLYNLAAGNWEGGLHAAVQVSGSAGYLQTPCLHYTYEDIADHLRKINNYSSQAARDMFEAGKTFSYWKTTTSPIWRFFRDYILKQGFRDKFPGLVIAAVSMHYVFSKHAKLHELELSGKRDTKL